MFIQVASPPQTDSSYIALGFSAPIHHESGVMRSCMVFPGAFYVRHLVRSSRDLTVIESSPMFYEESYAHLRGKWMVFYQFAEFDI